MLWCAGLHHRTRASAAGIAGTPGDQHAELCRDHVEPLGDVLPDPRHLAAPARAHRALRFDVPFHPWKMRGQPAAIAGSTPGPAVRLAPDDLSALFLGAV